MMRNENIKPESREVHREGFKGETARRNFIAASGLISTALFSGVPFASATEKKPDAEQLFLGVEKQARAEALKKVKMVFGSLVLRPADGVLVPDMTLSKLNKPSRAGIVIPPTGYLLFAVETHQPIYVEGGMVLMHGDNLRPGLRVSVFQNSTLIGAPVVSALEGQMKKLGYVAAGTEPPEGITPWRAGTSDGDIGIRPETDVSLKRWYMPKGVHYLMVAAPFFRDGGMFQSLTLTPLPEKVEEPLYSFAVFADVHITNSRSVWVHTKMGDTVHVELERSLSQLKAEDFSFALIAGDMVDTGTASQYQKLAAAIKNSGLPVFGCMGNHDVVVSEGRSNAFEYCSELFPSKGFNYVHQQKNNGKPHLNIITLDWYPAYQSDFLAKALEENGDVPVLLMTHSCMMPLSKRTPDGYQLAACPPSREIIKLLKESDAQSITAINGHYHYNAFDQVGKISMLQNAAFSEFPNTYRVIRAYEDRLEWELRRAENFGFVRDSFVDEKEVTWMVLDAPENISGTIPLKQTRKEPFFSFGVIADIQYADKEKKGVRHYREAITKLDECVEELNRQDLAFTIQLGDIIDGNETKEKTHSDLKHTLESFNKLSMPKYHVVGNHCLVAGKESLRENLNLSEFHYDFTVPSANGWRFVVLNGNDAGYGVLGGEQLRWLRSTLAQASAKGEKVIVFNHFALLEGAAKHHRMKTPEPVRSLINESGCVVAYFAGHDHAGGYTVEDGIHHITVKGMVEAPTRNAYAVIEVYPDKLKEVGYGKEPSRELDFKALPIIGR